MLWGTAVSLLFALPFLWCAWALASEARELYPATKSRVYRELASGSDAIRWAYVSVGDVRALHVFFVDGKSVSLQARRHDAEALLAFVQKRVPQAIIGFGAEREFEYWEIVRQSRSGADQGDVT